jgi:hypothetical protein
MRRYLGRVGIAAFAAFCCSAAAVTSMADENGRVTFRFTNSAVHKIYVKFFSQSRSAVWPKAGQSYPLTDAKEHAFPLNCSIGEKICYGAFYASGASWGVGRNGKTRCDGCCQTCGPEDERISHHWDLQDAPKAD